MKTTRFANAIRRPVRLRLHLRRGLRFGAWSFSGTWILVLGAFLPGCARHHQLASTPPVSYEKPLSSPGTKFSALPPPVQNSIRAEAGSAEIADIVKDTSSEAPVYIIYFVNAKLLPPLFLAPDGSVLHPDLTVARGAAGDAFATSTSGPVSGVMLRDLPTPVLKAVQEAAPGGQIANINKQMWGNRAMYIVSFKEEARFPKMYITAEGTVLKDAPH